MKINCYYDLPVGGGWSIPYYFDTICNTLIDAYPEISFTKIDSRDIDRENRVPCWMFGHHWMVIENPETKKFFVMSYWDNLGCAVGREHIQPSNWSEVFTSSGVHNSGIKYTPFSYLLPELKSESIIKNYENIKNEDRKIPEKLSFRGLLYGFRKHLFNDNRFNIINKNINHLIYEDYISELNDNAINLSLNGAGEICYRDMEVLGVGSALFREKLTLKFDEDLIPDYHYISYDLSSIKDKRGNLKTYYEMSADIIHKRFLDVKDDTDYINEVARNGKEWYERNVPINQHGIIAKKLIKLEKLI